MEDIKEVNKALKVLNYLCRSMRTAPAGCPADTVRLGFSQQRGSVCLWWFLSLTDKMLLRAMSLDANK